MRSFQRAIEEFKERGIAVAAITVDSQEINRGQCEKLGLDYPILSDADASVTKRYNLLHPGAGPKGTDIPRPAEILVDSEGKVRWLNLTENATLRARPEDVLEAWETYVVAQ